MKTEEEIRKKLNETEERLNELMSEGKENSQENEDTEADRDLLKWVLEC